MRHKNFTGRVLIVVLVIIAALAFVFPTNGQSLNANNQEIIAGGEHQQAELVSGNWVLTDRKMERFNDANVTQWTGSEQNLLATCQWKDVLNIIHTISGGFKWEEPPRTMAPGAYEKFAATYTNDEYSTDNRVLVGVKVKIDNTSSDYITSGTGAIDVLRLTKDNRNYNTETKTGFFSAPKTLLGDSKDMVLSVDCYIGQDHYVSTYTYSWVGEESAAK